MILPDAEKHSTSFDGVQREVPTHRGQVTDERGAPRSSGQGRPCTALLVGLHGPIALTPASRSLDNSTPDGF